MTRLSATRIALLLSDHHIAAKWRAFHSLEKYTAFLIRALEPLSPPVNFSIIEQRSIQSLLIFRKGSRAMKNDLSIVHRFIEPIFQFLIFQFSRYFEIYRRSNLYSRKVLFKIVFKATEGGGGGGEFRQISP